MNPYTVIFWDNVNHQGVVAQVVAIDPNDAVVLAIRQHFEDTVEPTDGQLIAVIYGNADRCVVQWDDRFVWFPREA